MEESEARGGEGVGVRADEALALARGGVGVRVAEGEAEALP